MPFQHAITQLAATSANFRSCSKMESAPVNKEAIISVAKEIDSAITFLKVANLGGLSALVSLVRQWGADRNITGPDAKATVHTQFEKLREEFLELEDAIAREDQQELIDAVGDMTVVLILLSELAGVKFETCLVAAYDEIKERKGSMIDGAFVKNVKTNAFTGVIGDGSRPIIDKDFGVVILADGTEIQPGENHPTQL